MRLIDADEIPMRTSHVMDMQDLYLPAHFLEWVIDECPTIDAVPVVRCEDCKYWYGYKNMDDGQWGECEPTVTLRREDFFCKDGKRREE